MAFEAENLTLEDVVLCVASPEQRTRSWMLNGASWAPPMSLDEYLQRETRLSETELSRDGGCKYWVLHRRGEPNDIISACESTGKTVLITDANGSRTARAYAIASVFTNPAYRGKGMASHMLKGVQEAMDADSDCSVLYSDIGKEFYANIGWAVYPSDQVTLHVAPGYNKSEVPAGVRLLEREEVKALCEQDTTALAEQFADLAKQTGDGATHVAFAPNFVQVDWHFTRDAYVATVMHNKEVQYRGAATEDGSSWIYWDHDFRENKLKVLRIVGKDAAKVQQLLQAALVEAANWSLDKVLVWAPDAAVEEAAKAIGASKEGVVDVVFDERDKGSIPSLRWKQGEERKTIWHENQYYAWC